MTLDEIRHQLSTARGMPRAAILAAIDQAEALSPEIIGLVELAAAEAMLTVPQELFMFYGIHALAAAGRTELYDPLLLLLERRWYDIEGLLSDAEIQSLLISTSGQDCKAPYHLLWDGNISGSVKLDLFLLIAWQVREGRASREEFVAFLDRFDREATADPDDLAWYGWQCAIMLLGLTQFEERVRAGWAAGRVDLDNDADRQEWLRNLHQVAREPAAKKIIAAYHLHPIVDVFASLRWMEVLGLDLPPEEDSENPDDPARDVRLDADERGWLRDFLAAPIPPYGTMSQQCLDGFLTALIAGPTAPPIEEWWRCIWNDGEGAEEPEYDTPEQAAYVRTLLDRHWQTIERRLRAGYRHTPWVEEDMTADLIEDWAVGFSTGMDLNSDAWDRVGEHKVAGLAVGSILALLPAAHLAVEDAEMEPLTDSERARVVSGLPACIRAIHAFWHGLPVPPLFEPRRSRKIGRNEPCPCGSGRKYKKCCGANPPSAVH